MGTWIIVLIRIGHCHWWGVPPSSTINLKFVLVVNLSHNPTLVGGERTQRDVIKKFSPLDTRHTQQDHFDQHLSWWCITG